MDKSEFLKLVVPLIQKYAPEYNIQAVSAVIAQCILESGWGKSTLASKYNNYFGMKCGTAWKGRSVNMVTQEEYNPGTKTKITDNFRVYDNLEDGIKGYFEFIQLPRYANLKGVKDARTYLELIVADGYATDSSYVTSCMRLVDDYDLKDYDPDSSKASANGQEKPITANDVINLLRSWIGKSERDGSYKEIIDIYNSHIPLAQGYKVSYSDSWCDVTVSAAFIKLGAESLIGGTECGVERHIQLFKAVGIWIEDGTIVPDPGYIITYNWDSGTQPNNGFADHIGVVESVENNWITVIEGNYGGDVARRYIKVGDGYIRGYATPRYSKAKATVTAVAPEPNTTISSFTTSAGLNKIPKWVGRVTANALNVRSWAGTEFPNIKSYPLLNRNNLVDVCDTVTALDGTKWYYIRIAGKIYGFVHSAWIAKA